MMKQLRIISLCAAFILLCCAMAAADETSVPRHIQAKARGLFPAATGRPAAPDQVVDAALLQSWLQNPDDHVRAWACYALGEARSPAHAPDLRAMLADPDPDVTRLAAKALGKLRDRAAVPALCRVMLDTACCCKVRCAAACALGMIGDSQANQALGLACRDANTRIAAQAQKSLARLGGTTAG